jgi:hypothetical protein
MQVKNCHIEAGKIVVSPDAGTIGQAGSAVRGIMPEATGQTTIQICGPLVQAIDAPDAVQRLEAGGFLTKAVRLIAHALPKRDAVWWACMCAFHTAPADLAESDRLARELAENWVRQQTDRLRREAMAKAEAANFATPETWAAVAAFWSGDSMAPAGQKAVPPAPHLCGTAVAGAVMLAAARGDPLWQSARVKRFLGSGRDIAAGGRGQLPPACRLPTCAESLSFDTTSRYMPRHTIGRSLGG